MLTSIEAKNLNNVLYTQFWLSVLQSPTIFKILNFKVSSTISF